MDTKRSRLLELSKQRKGRCYDGYHPLAKYHRGAYECDWVSPYTKCSHNLDSDIFVLLQDWSSDEWLKKPVDWEVAKVGHAPTLPTNRNLKRLLKDVFGKELKDIFATNLFPFIKNGNVSARVPNCDLVRAADEFALPQIRIVKPKIVICLGLVTFNAVSKACKGPQQKRLADAIKHPFQFEDRWIWCQAHTGSRGQNNRGKAQVLKDWRKMKSRLSQK